MTIAEYAARVRRLRKLVPDLESRFTDAEGLTLIGTVDGSRVILAGEPVIVEDFEQAVAQSMTSLVQALSIPVPYAPFGRFDRSGKEVKGR